MIALTLLLLGFLWGYVGYCAPRYFWLRDWDERPPLAVAIIGIFLGPAAWFVGGILHGRD